MSEGTSELNDFCSDMLEAIQVEDSLSPYMTKFQEYCQQIRENKVLNPPNEAVTDNFLNDFCVTLIDTILNLV